jgi:hypothetical protein
MKDKTYTPSNKEHTIKTVKQLFAVMTKENLPCLMADLFKTGELMVSLDAINKIAAKNAGEKYKKIELPVFKWIDDGKNNLNQVTLSDKEGNTLDIGDMVRNAEFS